MNNINEALIIYSHTYSSLYTLLLQLTIIKFKKKIEIELID